MEVAYKVKVIFKKSLNNDIYIYEKSCKDWEFSLYMEIIFKRVTRSNIRYKVNLKTLEKVYLMNFRKTNKIYSTKCYFLFYLFKKIILLYKVKILYM